MRGLLTASLNSQRMINPRWDAEKGSLSPGPPKSGKRNQLTLPINLLPSYFKKPLNNSSYKIQASVNSKKEVFALIKLDGNFDTVTNFKRLLTHYTPMLPENFIQFDPESVLENFGNLKLEIETIFPEKGLRNIFNMNGERSGFAKVNKYDWGVEECRDRAGGTRMTSAYKPGPGMRGENPEEEFMLFSDVLFKTIKTMLYADQYARF